MSLTDAPLTSWETIVGHEQVIARLRSGLARGRLAGTYLFVGPEGIGKRTVALQLAADLLCDQPDANLVACGDCSSCHMLHAGQHPDLLEVKRPPDKAVLPLKLFVGEDGHRQTGLCHAIALRPYRSRWKVALIDDADYLTNVTANALLKTLEEPPPQSVIILLASSLSRQLPTIRSRSQIVHFQPLTAHQIEQVLRERQLLPDELQEHTVRLAELANGSLAQALAWADPELLAFRERLLAKLAQPDWNSMQVAAAVHEFVQAVGKDNAPRRARLLLVIDVVRQSLRRRLHSVLTDAPEADPTPWTAALDRCEEADHQVAANANLALLIECWCDDLFTLTRVKEESA